MTKIYAVTVTRELIAATIDISLEDVAVTGAGLGLSPGLSAVVGRVKL